MKNSRKKNKFTNLMTVIVMISLFVAMFSPSCAGTGNPAQADNPEGGHTITLSPEDSNQAPQAELAEAEKEEPLPKEEPVEVQATAEEANEPPVPLIVEEVRNISSKPAESEPKAQAAAERAEGKLFKEAVIWMLIALLIVLLITLVAVCLISATMGKVNMGLESLCGSIPGISSRISLILEKVNSLSALPDMLAALTEMARGNRTILRMLLTDDVLREEIRNALKAGNTNRLEAFHALGFLPDNINTPMDSLDNTLLHIALSKGVFSLAAVKWIWEKFKDTLKFDLKNKDGMTAMDLARKRLVETVKDNNEELACGMFSLFRKAGLYPDVDARVTDLNSTLAHLAAHRGMTKLLGLLKEAEAKFDLKNKKNDTPKDVLKDALANAVKQKDKDKLEELLKLGLLDKELINKKMYEWKRSLVHFAADAGAIDILELLVENGGKLDLQDRYNQTPADLAFKCLKTINKDEIGLFERLWYLKILNKDNINKADEHTGNTLAHLAAIRGLTKVYAWLQEKGADVNKRNNKNKTPGQIILEKLAKAQEREKSQQSEQDEDN